MRNRLRNIIINRVLSGSPTDDAAEAYFAAAGITDSTQKNAWTTAVLAMKAANIYSKLIAAYPYLGGTAATHKWNAIDPRDLDAAYRITFSGTITHNSNGVTFDGSTGWGDLHINPSVVFSATYLSMHNYVKVATNTGIVMAGGSGVFEWTVNANGNNAGSAGVTPPAGITYGMFSNTRNGATQVNATIDGFNYYGDAGTFTGYAGTSMNVGRNTAGNLYFAGTVGFQAVGRLTTDEAQALDIIIYNYQLALSRTAVAANKLAIFFGDSITAGLGASPSTLRWTTVFVGLKAWKEVNRGQNGTTLESNAGSPSSMINRTAEIPKPGRAGVGLFISYGVNDVTNILISTPGFSTSNFQANLSTIITYAKSIGWVDSKIFIIDGYYENANSWLGQGSGLGLPIWVTLRANAGSAVAASGGTWIDPFTACGDSDFFEVSDPKIHPNTVGHGKYAVFINAAIP